MFLFRTAGAPPGARGAPPSPPAGGGGGVGGEGGRFPAARCAAILAAASGRPASSPDRRSMPESKTLRIGAGAGFQGDRLEPAVILASQGGLDYLVLECLAERTIALAQLRKLQEPGTGFDPLLEARMETLLPLVARSGLRILTNMGAALLPGARHVG